MYPVFRERYPPGGRLSVTNSDAAEIGILRSPAPSPPLRIVLPPPPIPIPRTAAPMGRGEKRREKRHETKHECRGSTQKRGGGLVRMLIPFPPCRWPRQGSAKPARGSLQRGGGSLGQTASGGGATHLLHQEGGAFQIKQLDWPLPRATFPL